MLLDVAATTREIIGENSLRRARTRARSKSPFVKKRSKSPFRPLACEDSLGNSNTSRSCDDEGSFLAFKNGAEDYSKRTQSTHTLTSNESSHGNNSFRNAKFSPTPAERRLSNSLRWSPRRSPRRSPRNEFQFADFSDSGIIGSPPLTNVDGHALETDHGTNNNSYRSNSHRSISHRSNEGVSSYYQPSKASLGSQAQTSKKPKRIRSRSKGTNVSHKSNGTTNGISDEFSKRSKSCEPKKTKTKTTSRSKSCERESSTKTKKKHSPSLSRHRKRPSSTKTIEKRSSTKSYSKGSKGLHESWRSDTVVEERRKQKTEKSKKIKHISKTKKKKADDGKPDDINTVLTFFEDMAIQKQENERSRAPTSRGMGKRSESAKCVTRRSYSPAARRSLSPSKYNMGRSLSPSKYAMGDYGSDQDIMETSSLRRHRRSSAPAMTSFQQFGGHEFEDFDDSQSKPAQKILFDVSELASLEIIRLGDDNSLKLDLFDLMKHLKRQQLKNAQR